LQAKLLRVIETGAFRRVGAEEDMSSDVRILASSNRRPEDAIEEGRLRQDLYFRLARFQISIPPLRKRGRDIAGLAAFFIDELNQQYEGNKVMTPDAVELLARYPWPGNIREMRATIERAYILTSAEITAEDLGDLDVGEERQGEMIEISKHATIAEAEKKLILAVLEDSGGSKTRAAESLGISLKTLYNRLNDYELDGS
ncbi:MAG: sigma 54-interacting transcriptional regulator, partial [Pseudomonadales bacterium]|nr:sigma 54-interacting transcriptional regulator [Pseudomonadales bacterium]